MLGSTFPVLEVIAIVGFVVLLLIMAVLTPWVKHGNRNITIAIVVVVGMLVALGYEMSPFSG